MIVFVDTNFFLQCKKYDQLPWSEITQNKKISILVSRPVQIEIDRHKNDGNSRRSKRAREATSLFRNMLNANDYSIQCSVNQIDITLSFAMNYSMIELSEVQSGLDLSNVDDQILAYVRMYISRNKQDSANCFFLSNDTNALLTASTNNIPAIPIPDTWLLPAENDEKDKEIIKLKKELLELQNKEPKISFDLTISKDYLASNGNTINKNEYHILSSEYSSLADDETNALTQLFVDKHKEKTVFDEPPYNGSSLLRAMWTYVPPSDSEINEYHKRYIEWKNKIYQMISEYPDLHNDISNTFPFNVTISNIGNIPAKGVLIEFKIIKGGFLDNPDFEENKRSLLQLAYPTPPEPPEGHFKDTYASVLASLAATRFPKQFTYTPVITPTLKNYLPKPRDRNSFYWKGGRPDKKETSWIFECEEFRHKIGIEQFDYYMVFNENSGKIVFSVTISASNLSNPIQETYVLFKTKNKVDIKQSILHLLECGVTEKIMKKIEGNGEND